MKTESFCMRTDYELIEFSQHGIFKARDIRAIYLKKDDQPIESLPDESDSEDS